MLYEVRPTKIVDVYKKVLILILMEYALWAQMLSFELKNLSEVLILILMEYALWVVSIWAASDFYTS